MLAVGQTGVIRGRQIEAEDLEQIRSWRAAHPEWSRRRLSLELASYWDWRTPTGQLKDIAVRDILNRLAGLGLIVLPARQRRGGRQAVRAAQADPQSCLSLEGVEASAPTGLAELLPLSWHQARRGDHHRVLVARYLSQYHYLGYPDPLGHIHYLVRDRRGREVACLLFGPAAWKVGPRDQFLGWSSAQRARGLGHIANNSRFLILPGAQACHLASHVLAQGVRHLCADWPLQHGRALWLVESFVERERFAGTCYQAANWLKVGQTQGRTRNDRWHRGQAPVKDIYLWPAKTDVPQRCCAL
jgi:Domain of unknown function (DUF4338)